MEAGEAQLKGELPAVALLGSRAAGCLTHLLEAFRKCTGSVYSNQSNVTQKSLLSLSWVRALLHAPPGSQFTSPPPSSHSQHCVLWAGTHFPKGLLHWTAPWLITSKANKVVVNTTVPFIVFFVSLFFLKSTENSYYCQRQTWQSHLVFHDQWQNQPGDPQGIPWTPNQKSLNLHDTSHMCHVLHEAEEWGKKGPL